MTRVVSNSTTFTSDNQHARDIFPEGTCFHGQIQALSHQVDGHRHTKSVGVAQRLFRLSFEVFSAHATSCQHVVFRSSRSTCWQIRSITLFSPSLPWRNPRSVSSSPFRAQPCLTSRVVRH